MERRLPSHPFPLPISSWLCTQCYTHTCTHMHTHTCTHMHTHTHIHTHAHSHTHTHIYACTQVTNQSIVLNGIFSAIPYTLLFIVVILGGQVADWMRKRLFPTVVVRKAFTAAGKEYEIRQTIQLWKQLNYCSVHRVVHEASTPNYII